MRFFFLFGLFVFEHFAWAFVNNWLLFKMITSDDGQDKETAQLLFEISFSFHLLCKCVCVQQERWLTRQSPSIKKRIAHVDSPISKSMFRSVADSQWPSPTFFFFNSLSLSCFSLLHSLSDFTAAKLYEQFSGSINLSQQLLVPGPGVLIDKHIWQLLLANDEWFYSFISI